MKLPEAVEGGGLEPDVNSGCQIAALEVDRVDAEAAARARVGGEDA